jgi:twitching motility protein PilT
VAQLDPLLKALVDRGASELVLGDGLQPSFRFGDDLRPVSPRVLSRAQIDLLVSEIAPADLASTLASGGPASFVCRSAGRSFVCRVDATGARLSREPQPAPVAPAPAGAHPPVPQGDVSDRDAAPAAPPVAPVREATGSAPDGSDRAEVERLLRRMVELGASDLHLCSAEAPMVRINGDMVRMEGEAPLSPGRAAGLLESILPPRNRDEYRATHDTDFAYEIPELSRFRANVFTDRKGPGAVFRTIPTKILTAEDLGLSQAILDLCALPKGLVLVTGPTGSGKSTTLAAMVDHINKTRSDHIITIEDPIEFVHGNQKCLVNQREIVTHTDGFKKALRAALREDPDIVLVGEMRDLETIAIAIETAETGHLVFGTLHTTTACSTVDRIIDQFPADRQAQIRTMLSESLKGVVSQTLVKKIGGGRAAALEVLLVTAAIANLIREGKTFQIPSLMQTGKKMGMVLLNDALLELVKKKFVDPEEAYRKAIDKAGFARALAAAGHRVAASAQS